MKSLAFVTYSNQPQLTEDDRSVLPFLHGCRVEAISWDKPGVAWDKFDAVILRSCWDYHLRFREFSNWLGQLEETKVRLFNNFEIVRWNADKSYLRELAAAQIPTIPTVWLEKNSRVALGEVLQNQDWKKAVVKPAISATAFQTWVTAPETADREELVLERMLENSAVLLQPFVGEVVAKGEWSFVFFNKEYSHAALKRAKAGDFRVQSEFGGYVDETAPPAESLIEQARKVLDAVRDDLLYARVDGVEIDGKFYLMELELIEPALFLKSCRRAAQKFAEAILSEIHK